MVILVYSLIWFVLDFSFHKYVLILGSDEEGDYTLDIDSVTLEDDASFQCQVNYDDNYYLDLYGQHQPDFRWEQHLEELNQSGLDMLYSQ